MRQKNVVTAVLLSASIFTISQTVHAEIPGFYASAQLGYGHNHMSTSNLVSIHNGSSAVALPNLNSIALAYRLSFGYQVNQNLAIEVGYRRFRNTDICAGNSTDYAAVASSQERAFDLLGKSILPLSSQLSLYGKWGIAYVKPNSQGYATTTGRYTASTTRYSNTLEPTFGLGFSYALKPNVPIDFSWNRIQKLGGKNHAPSSDFYAVGVAYYFG